MLKVRSVGFSINLISMFTVNSKDTRTTFDGVPMFSLLTWNTQSSLIWCFDSFEQVYVCWDVLMIF